MALLITARQRLLTTTLPRASCRQCSASSRLVPPPGMTLEHAMFSSSITARQWKSKRIGSHRRTQGVPKKRGEGHCCGLPPS